jgi:hypothetical protein
VYKENAFERKLDYLERVPKSKSIAYSSSTLKKDDVTGIEAKGNEIIVKDFFI